MGDVMIRLVFVAAFLVAVWYGYQCIYFYWTSDPDQAEHFAGRPKIVYTVGAFLLWTLMATVVGVGLGGLWLKYLGLL